MTVASDLWEMINHSDGIVARPIGKGNGQATQGTSKKIGDFSLDTTFLAHESVHFFARERGQPVSVRAKCQGVS
jgi:hypothetical protein